ncbi:MAG: 30S ribosomal protein S20 [Puniceicoccaceae bacterium]
MANLKSSKKDIRRTARRTERNTAAKTRLKTMRKKAVGESSDEDKNAYASALDKAVKGGVIHKNKAAREKSKIARGSLHSKTTH